MLKLSKKREKARDTDPGAERREVVRTTGNHNEGEFLETCPTETLINLVSKQEENRFHALSR